MVRVCNGVQDFVAFGLEFMNWTEKEAGRYTSSLLAELMHDYNFTVELSQDFLSDYLLFVFNDERKVFVEEINVEIYELLYDLEDITDFDIYKLFIDIISSNKDVFVKVENK